MRRMAALPVLIALAGSLPAAQPRNDAVRITTAVIGKRPFKFRIAHLLDPGSDGVGLLEKQN